MRRVRRFARGAVWSLLAVTLVVSTFVAGAMAYAEFRNQERLVIDSPRGIDEAMYIPIGGIDQWVQIRGQNRDNPVLFWVHGGPGFSTVPSTPGFVSWERDFTLVMWDQRGDGKTFEKSGSSIAPTMTIERMAKDGIEVVKFLREHLKKSKVILLGHSWGSMLGLHMIAQRPDLFFAYVGTGQNVNVNRGLEIGYPEILKKARAAGNGHAVTELEAVGPPPYADAQRVWVPIGWENRMDGPRPPTSVSGFGNIVFDALFRSYLRRGATFSQELMLPAMLGEDSFSVTTHFDVPVVFIQGETDIITPTALARDYFDHIDAPKKEFVLVPQAGHLAIFSARDAFLKDLVAHVRPLATE